MAKIKYLKEEMKRMKEFYEKKFSEIDPYYRNKLN